MATKTNQSTLATITEAELKQRVQSAYDCFSRAKENAAEAAAHAYLFYRDTQSGDPRRWFQRDLANIIVITDKWNADLKTRFQRADDFVAEKLAPGDHLNNPPANPAEKLVHDEERKKLQADHAMKKPERRKLRYVAPAAREGASKFTIVVKCIFRFRFEDQASRVNRYCLALEWIEKNCSGMSNLDVAVIKAAFKANHGFDACVAEQAKIYPDGDSVEEARISQEAIRTKARLKLKEEPPKGSIPMTILNPKDGFGLALVYTHGATVDVLGDAGASDADIERAITRLGSGLEVDTDSATEFVGRVLKIGSMIPEGAEVTLDDGKDTKVYTQRIISLRPDNGGEQELVVSLNRAEASAILHARPREKHIMPPTSGPAVLQIDDRKRLEQQVRDPGHRSLITITANANPVTADGTAALGPLSWACQNSALVDDPKMKSINTLYWTRLGSINARPLDVETFQPQFEGVLEASDIQLIRNLLPKPKAAPKAKEDEAKDEVTKTAKKSTDKTPRVVSLRIKDNTLTLIYGDADPLELEFLNQSVEVVNLRMRVADLYTTMGVLQEMDCQSVDFSGDDGGLVKFAWNDGYGFYDLHHPTCSSDGKLQSRRVNLLRVQQQAAAIAAE